MGGVGGGNVCDSGERKCNKLSCFTHLELVYLFIDRALCSVKLSKAFVTDSLGSVVAEVGKCQLVLGAVVAKDPPTSSTRQHTHNVM